MSIKKKGSQKDQWNQLNQSLTNSGYCSNIKYKASARLTLLSRTLSNYRRGHEFGGEDVRGSRLASPPIRVRGATGEGVRWEEGSQAVGGRTRPARWLNSGRTPGRGHNSHITLLLYRVIGMFYMCTDQYSSH